MLGEKRSCAASNCVGDQTAIAVAALAVIGVAIRIVRGRRELEKKRPEEKAGT